MKKTISIIILIFALTISSTGEKFSKINKERPIHTYSIVARDPGTGQLGVAVQSHWFSVGPLVPWIEAGVGAIATQSFVEVSYGPLGLSLMRAGKSAPQALKALIEVDPNKEVRQVAMIDNQGRIAAHTGELCISEAGHLTGDQFSVQANLMLNNTVWKAMAAAYESTDGDLTDRLLAALEAAEKEGGDIRGRQSAAIIVVTGNPTGQSWQDRIVDLRVEDHPDPVEELKRLVAVHRAYEHMNKGDEYMAEENIEAALKEYSKAEQMAPYNIEMAFWHAVTLASLDKVRESLPLFKKVFEADHNWAVLLPRLPKSGLLPDKPKLIKKILSVAPRK
ncbi:MAG: DUF1028 domain-containing protein [Candidatus Aminicenantes bacterium]|nr:MAG: DUF1028 domain-containing protein [Candidatus Aminicenantes bacterium]